MKSLVRANDKSSNSDSLAAVPENLVAALQQAKGIDRFGLGFVQADGSTRERTWQQVANEAEHRGARLLQLGLIKGQRVGILAHEEEPFTFAFFGAVLAGLIPVPMSPPSPMGDPELQRQRIAGILGRSGAACVLGPADLSPMMGSLTGACPALKSYATYEELVPLGGALEAIPEIAVPEPDDLCFLQFTSGSTSQPKGVEITHGNIVRNTEARHNLLGTDVSRRVAVTWTPLFHDMGLIGSLIPSALYHCPHVLIPTMMFVRKPQLWLEMIHRYRATVTTANNFALRAAMKRLAPGTELDLSSVRMIIIGGEPIQPELAETFIKTMRPYGLRDTALSPAYGMAEATLAISTTREEDCLTAMTIARDAYERGEVRVATHDEASLRVVDCGFPLPHHELAILDRESNPLPDHRVGEIAFRGPSVSRGYYDDPEATAVVFRDGWLRTGDLGFVHEGRLFISGRAKDLIIIAGRNIYPQDIEWTVSQLPGVRPGHVIAFSIPGPEGEQLVVLAEHAHGHERSELERHVRERLVREFGVQPHGIVMTNSGDLPQTSSGKPRRRQARQDYLNGRFARP